MVRHELGVRCWRLDHEDFCGPRCHICSVRCAQRPAAVAGRCDHHLRLRALRDLKRSSTNRAHAQVRAWSRCWVTVRVLGWVGQRHRHVQNQGLGKGLDLERDAVNVQRSSGRWHSIVLLQACHREAGTHAGVVDQHGRRKAVRRHSRHHPGRAAAVWLVRLGGERSVNIKVPQV